MTCIDCEAEGRKVTCIFDTKQNGEVCPRCRRVFSPLIQGGNFHYTEKRFMIAAMEKRRRLMGACNLALAERIIRERN